VKAEQTVEEIFSSVSNIQASGLNPPPAKTVLSPRSAEACLRHGVNPEILRIRDLESFYDPNVDPAVQRMRHEAYSQRRHEMMHLVRTERKKLINAEIKAQTMGQNAAGGLTPGAIMAQQAKANATFVEAEEKRMLKMRRRQEKEIEQMLQFEIKMSEIQKERDRRMEIEKQKEEKRKREKEKRMREIAEERRLKELRRKAMEDAEEELRQEQARAMYQKEKQLQAEREAKEKAQRIEARNREEERKRKQEEHRLQTQRILDEQQAAIKARLEQMEKQEAERQAVILEKQEVQKRKMMDRRKAIEKRIQRNMKMAQKIEEKRKEDFYAKQEHHEKLRAEHLDAQARDRELHRRQQELLEQRRLMVLAQTRRDEERRKEELTERFAEEEINVQRVKEAQDRNHMLIREKKGLRQAMKLENVNRIKRISEYRRLETLRRIHEGDKRIEEMMRRKSEIVESRKNNALKVKIQKDALMRVMEEAQTNSTKATKMIKQFLTSGEVQSKKKTKRKAARSRSAGALPRNTSAPSMEALGPKPEAPSLENRLAPQEAEPAAYISPYEAGPQMAQNAPTTVTF